MRLEMRSTASCRMEAKKSFVPVLALIGQQMSLRMRRNCRRAESGQPGVKSIMKQLTSSTAHSNTMPSSNVADAHDALLSRSMKLLVDGLGSSKPTSSPYLRLVASRNSSSFFMLLTAEQSRSKHRNVESCSRFAVSGMRIFPISAPVKGTSDREMYPIWASHWLRAFSLSDSEPACAKKLC